MRQYARMLSACIDEMRETYEIFGWVWRELTHPVARHRFLIFIALLGATILLLSLQPLAFSWVITALSTGDIGFLWVALATVASLAIIQEGSSFATNLMRELVFNRNVASIHDRINSRFLAKTLHQHVDESSSLNYANLERAKNRVEQVQSMLLFETSRVCIMLVLSYVLLWSISLVAGAVMTALVAIHVTWSLYLNYRVACDTKEIEQGFRRHNREMVERWEKIVRVKTSGKAASERERLRADFDETLRKDWDFWSWFIKQSALRETIGIVFYLGLIAYGAHLVTSGAWQVGTLVPLFTWSMQLAQNLWYLGHAERQLNEHVPYIKTMKEVLEAPVSFTENEGVRLQGHEPVSVAFNNVGLTYYEGDTAMPVLRNISFQVAPGEKVALIGPSGAGKTTIMKLLLRFMDPTTGEVHVNGRDLRDIQLVSWMEHLGYIAQQPQILDGTIRYNLTFGLSDEDAARITDKELWDVMRLLQIDFGERLTHGLDTRVGRDGVKLSGGQAQRLLIGAAVVKRPSFMLIDEATSSLDSTTERAVQNGLETALSGPTGALIIAHRLSTVRSMCNRFLVLRQIEEVCDGSSQVEASGGSFEELYEYSPTFRMLSSDQGIAI